MISDLIFFLSMHVLQSLLLISDKLSTRSDNLLCMNLKVSINFNLYVTVLSLSCSFLTGTEKLIYFSVFSPKHSNSPLNSSANSLSGYEVVIVFWTIMNFYTNFLWYFIIQITNAMGSPFKFSCIMTIISNFFV